MPRDHELDVLHVFDVVALELVDRHVGEMRAGHRAEPVEHREEFVVPCRHGGRRQEVAHRERVDEPVIELLVAYRVGYRPRSGAVALRLRQDDILRIDTKSFLGRPGDVVLRVNGAGQVRVQVRALRHAMQERAQRGVILARRPELLGGDDRVEFAGEQGKAEQENERRQEDGGKDDPASQDFCPGCALCNAKLAVQRAELNRADRGVRLRAANIIPPLAGSFPSAGKNRRDGGRHRHCPRGSRGTNIYRVAASWSESMRAHAGKGDPSLHQ
jgi:hypothetical protein